MTLHLDIYIPIMASVILHEIAHGYAAYRLGDPTAKEMGRLTLNPIPHMELWGSFVLPLSLLVVSGGTFALGWARGLPVQSHRFKSPNTLRSMALVCAAGPAANALLALWCWLAFSALDTTAWGPAAHPWLATGFAINCFLAVFNLLPIKFFGKPLDGWHIVNYFRAERPG